MRVLVNSEYEYVDAELFVVSVSVSRARVHNLPVVQRDGADEALLRQVLKRDASERAADLEAFHQSRDGDVLHLRKHKHG